MKNEEIYTKRKNEEIHDEEHRCGRGNKVISTSEEGQEERLG